MHACPGVPGAGSPVGRRGPEQHLFTITCTLFPWYEVLHAYAINNISQGRKPRHRSTQRSNKTRAVIVSSQVRRLFGCSRLPGMTRTGIQQHTAVYSQHFFTAGRLADTDIQKIGSWENIYQGTWYQVPGTRLLLLLFSH